MTFNPFLQVNIFKLQSTCIEGVSDLRKLDTNMTLCICKLLHSLFVDTDLVLTLQKGVKREAEVEVHIKASQTKRNTEYSSITLLCVLGPLHMPLRMYKLRVVCEFVDVITILA